MKFCVECRWVHLQQGVGPRCTNPKVNADNNEYLATKHNLNARSCEYERIGGWSYACGRSGRQWQFNEALLEDA